MHFSSKLPIVFIQSCFTMASSGAAPLLPASGAGLPFEIPTPSHTAHSKLSPGALATGHLDRMTC